MKRLLLFLCVLICGFAVTKSISIYYNQSNIEEVVLNNGNGPTSITVFPTPQTLKVGETSWVYAKQVGAIGGTYFTSADKSIATVTLGELASPYSYTTAAQITAVSPGKVNIYAKTMNGLSATCEVTVLPIEVTGVSLNVMNHTMNVGESFTLIPTVTPSNATTTFSWESSNSKVATVSGGKVTAVGAGNAIITVTTENGKFASCNIKVNPRMYNLTYHIGEGGTAIWNNTSYSGTGVVSIEEWSNITITLRPDDNHQVGIVEIDGEDVTNNLTGDQLSLLNVRQNIVLAVSFSERITTGVSTPLNHEDCNHVSNISGQNTGMLSRGIYIMNHKKILIK